MIVDLVDILTIRGGGMRVPLDLKMMMIISHRGLRYVEAPTFDSVHVPKLFSKWLADIDYYFDLYMWTIILIGRRCLTCA